MSFLTHLRACSLQDVTPCLHALVIEWRHDAADRITRFLGVGSLDGVLVDVE
jgi:hypothetical protein